MLWRRRVFVVVVVVVVYRCYRRCRRCCCCCRYCRCHRCRHWRRRASSRGGRESFWPRGGRCLVRRLGASAPACPSSLGCFRFPALKQQRLTSKKKALHLFSTRKLLLPQSLSLSLSSYSSLYIIFICISLSPCDRSVLQLSFPFGCWSLLSKSPASIGCTRLAVARGNCVSPSVAPLDASPDRASKQLRTDSLLYNGSIYICISCSWQQREFCAHRHGRRLVSANTYHLFSQPRPPTPTTMPSRISSTPQSIVSTSIQTLDGHIPSGVEAESASEKTPDCSFCENAPEFPLQRSQHTDKSTLNRSRRPNGATQTFRRNPSLSSTSHARDTSASSVSSAMTPGVYVPPHLHPSRNGSSVDSRLSKEQLLDIFKAQKDAEQFGDHVSNLFAEGWAPGLTNGASATVWGRREEAKDHQPGADICWDKNGSSQPLALQEMSAEEKEVISAPWLLSFHIYRLG